MPSWVQRLLAAEPTVVISVIAAALALAVTFGVHIDNSQIDAIKTFLADLLAFAGAVAGIRQSVYSPKTVASLQAGLDEPSDGAA